MKIVRTVNLGLGAYRVGAGAPEEQWVIYGLGSCIGLILSHAASGVSAMAHIVLPEGPVDTEDPGRYVNTVFPLLLREMARLGAHTVGTNAQLAGGAKMLNLSTLGDIGARNIDAVQRALVHYGIPVIAMEVGGTQGRTLRWSPWLRRAWVKEAGGQERLLIPA